MKEDYIRWVILLKNKCKQDSDTEKAQKYHVVPLTYQFTNLRVGSFAIKEELLLSVMLQNLTI